MEYVEKVTCNKCKSEYTRDIESIEVGKTLEMDQPLNALIIKKFKCKKCKSEEYSLSIEEKEKTKAKII